MNKIDHNDPLSKSANIVDNNIEQLKQLFPEIFKEDKIDWEELKATLGEHIDTENERFNFTWNGKTQARKEAQKPSTGTLRPCKEESVDWDNTENLYIEGDNLEVLKILQKSYHQKVKMIYIDPPYNTGKDFVYKDNYKDNLSNYLELTGQTDEDGKKLSTNSDASGRYHSNWLNMMYPRLKLARNLLTDDGVIFISIDDNEVDNLHKVCNEIFGEENFVAIFPWRKRTAKSDVPFGISQDYEWIIVYAKSKKFIAGIKSNTRKYYESDDFPNRPWRVHDMTKQSTASERPNSFFDMIDPKTNKIYPANPNSVWRITKDTFQSYYDQNRIIFPDDYNFMNISKPVFRYFKDDDAKKDGNMFGFSAVSTNLPKTIGMTQGGTKDFAELFETKVFTFPKPKSLISFLIKIGTPIQKNEIILDLFSGSATTAHAVMKLNAEDDGKRKHIQVQLPEPTDTKSEAYKSGYKTITEIGKERIRRAGKKIAEDNPEKAKDLDLGFKVFKLDSSNIKTWSADADSLEQDLFNAVDNIKVDRTENDLLFEILLKYGLDLTLPITEHKVDDAMIYSVGLGALIVCLSDNITVETATAIAELKEKQNPEICRVVFKDSGFKTDTIKTNVLQKLKQFKIEEVRSI